MPDCRTATEVDSYTRIRMGMLLDNFPVALAALRPGDDKVARRDTIQHHVVGIIC